MSAFEAEVVRRLRAGQKVERVADLAGIDRRTCVRIAHEAGLRITHDGRAEPISTQETPMHTAPGTTTTATPATAAKASAYLDHPDAKVRAAAKAAIDAHDRFRQLLRARTRRALGGDADPERAS